MQNKILPYSQGYFNKNGDLRRLGESINNIDDNFSDAWLETKNYKSGDIVIFKNSMYKAKTDNIGTVPTDPNTWDKIFVSSLINNLANSSDIRTDKWKDAPDNKTTTYFYEGQDVSEYDLPYTYCFIQVMKKNSGRGVAIAYQWNRGATADRWVNRLHDNWIGWVKLPN